MVAPHGYRYLPTSRRSPRPRAASCGPCSTAWSPTPSSRRRWSTSSSAPARSRARPARGCSRRRTRGACWPGGAGSPRSRSPAPAGTSHSGEVGSPFPFGERGRTNERPRLKVLIEFHLCYAHLVICRASYIYRSLYLLAMYLLHFTNIQ